jgi:hypothetical protein
MCCFTTTHNGARVFVRLWLTRLRLRPTSHANLQPNKSLARRLRCTQSPATCGTMNPRTPRHSASPNPGAGPTRQPPPLATQRRSNHPAFGGRAHSHSRTPKGMFALSGKTCLIYNNFSTPRLLASQGNGCSRMTGNSDAETRGIRIFPKPRRFGQPSVPKKRAEE